MYVASLIDIELLANIVETKSLTKGAKNSFISLPAASLRMKALEDRLGIKLLCRTSQGVMPTPAGRTFLQHGIVVLNHMRRLECDLHEYAAGTKGLVRVFANTTCSNEFLPPLLREYLVLHPNITVDLEEHLSPDIVHALSKGSADLGIVAGNILINELESRPFRKYRMVVITALSHALAGRESISLEEALDFEFVGLLQGGETNHACIREVAYSLDKQLKTRILAHNFEVQCSMVEAGVGIGIISDFSARRYATSMAISIIPITNSWAARDSYVCMRRSEELSKFVKDLFDFLASREVPAAVSAKQSLSLMSYGYGRA